MKNNTKDKNNLLYKILENISTYGVLYFGFMMLLASAYIKTEGLLYFGFIMAIIIPLTINYIEDKVL